MHFLEKLLEFIFLPSCGVCGKIGEGYLCEKCEKEIEKYRLNHTLNYSKNNIILRDNSNTKNNISDKNKASNMNDTNINQSVSSIDLIKKMHILEYKDIVRKLIIQYKFNDKSYLYKTFVKIIISDKKAFDFIKSYDIIIPVPIHKKRYKTRGYNQSELISRDLAHMCQVKCYTDVLIKMVNNQVQSTLNKNERLENVKDVYKLIKPEKINNKNVLIFDDIYTTGSTIMSCAKELEKAHVKKIGILTLAKD